MPRERRRASFDQTGSVLHRARQTPRPNHRRFDNDCCNASAPRSASSGCGSTTGFNRLRQSPSRGGTRKVGANVGGVAPNELARRAGLAAAYLARADMARPPSLRRQPEAEAPKDEGHSQDSDGGRERARVHDVHRRRTATSDAPWHRRTPPFARRMGLSAPMPLLPPLPLRTDVYLHNLYRPLSISHTHTLLRPALLHQPTPTRPQSPNRNLPPAATLSAAC